MSFELFFDTSSDDEDEVNSELAMFTEACQAAYEASKPEVHRTTVERDRYGAHGRLVMAYFSEQPQYDEATFRGQRSICRINEVYFRNSSIATDALLILCTEYLQMGATTSRDSLRIFCKDAKVIEIDDQLLVLIKRQVETELMLEEKFRDLCEEVFNFVKESEDVVKEVERLSCKDVAKEIVRLLKRGQKRELYKMTRL
ncbi:hypothetical protein Tco_0059520 [Tanacetum coccineum]